MADDWTEEERAFVARYHRAELRKTLGTVCVYAAVVALAALVALAAWAVGAFQ
jgi:hypothetical protein